MAPEKGPYAGYGNLPVDNVKCSGRRKIANQQKMMAR
jgi:hypothetical protein